jgi:hypothetical protein
MIMKFTVLGLLFLTPTAQTKVQAADIKGDLRYRVERIDQVGKDARVRDRVRARLGFYGKADERFDYGIRLASGSSDPVSSNQTLDGGFSSKGINLDLAYLKWTCPITGSKALLGKTKNPYKKPGKSSLVWDGDLNPEGVALQMKKWGAFLNLGRHWLDERSGTADSFVHVAQLGYEKEVGPIKLLAGASYFDYISVKDQTTLVDAADSFGNSTTASSEYTFDYNLTEIFIAVSATEMPFTFYVDYVKNGEATSNDTGYLAGFTIGKKYSLNYNYRNLEKDAVVGAYTDSDFKGGGTDGKGHLVSLGWKATDKSKLSITHLMNKTAINNGNDYNRTQLDLSLKF